jgi:hypothetical protein
MDWSGVGLCTLLGAIAGYGIGRLHESLINHQMFYRPDGGPCATTRRTLREVPTRIASRVSEARTDTRHGHLRHVRAVKGSLS